MRDKPFEVVGVDEDHVFVRPLQSAEQRRLLVRRADIEQIAGMGWQRDELRSRTADALPECGVTSYVAAIVFAASQSGSTPS